jgi:predicted nucleic acid-binding Zn ribbon protein
VRGIQSFLGDVVIHKEALRAARAQQTLRKWHLVVGDKLAERSWPDRFDHGVVWVAVTGSAWAQELRMNKDVLIQRLEELSGEKGLFRDLRFGVRPLQRPAAVEEIVEVIEEQKTTLTIREIAERRLREWADDSGTES